MSAAHSVAVLGTGTMGAPIARNLLRAGYEVRVWNRNPAKAAALVADGARHAANPAAAVTGAHAVITMLTDGPAVEVVLTGALSAVAPEAIWIQMSTVGLDACARLADLARRHAITFVDAPVSGSSGPAEAGELIILAAGAGKVRSRVEPIFDVLGHRTIWLDHTGAGSALKLALNNWLGILVEGMAETLTLSAAFGLDPKRFLEAVAAGPMASNYAMAKGAVMLDADFTPGFPLHLAVKDAELAAHAAQQHGIALALTGALLPRWHEAIAAGHGDDDVASVITTPTADLVRG
ncbi:NAD(P)-dependent oxidoreductase [Nocardia sp. NPDC060256]|uniref:NAD(P)-dependent oxidoreductase n=1 Tax=unclassified Nocardia TaxID=2637762 RepID=UPI00365F2CA1